MGDERFEARLVDAMHAAGRAVGRRTCYACGSTLIDRGPFVTDVADVDAEVVRIIGADSRVLYCPTCLVVTFVRVR